MPTVFTLAPVLVLNQNYEPLNICNVKRAIVLLGHEKAESLLSGRGKFYSPNQSFLVPSVIRMTYLVRRPRFQRRLSRREVFARDQHICQYCGKLGRDMTLDHVIPRSQGGTHTWENVVAACIFCNHRKAGRTPKEAGMDLLSKPKIPNPNYHLFYRKPIQDQWLQFAPWINL